MVIAVMRTKSVNLEHHQPNQVRGKESLGKQDETVYGHVPEMGSQ